MTKNKTLLETLGDFKRITPHTDLTKCNGLGRRAQITMNYYKLITLLGDPIVLDSSNDGKFNWCFTVDTNDGDEFVCSIYSDLNYSADTPLEQIEKWSISTKSNFQAWQVEQWLQQN